MPRAVGVLALQGDFAEHLAALGRLGIRGVEVRLPAHLEGVDELIIPGGESTTIDRLLDRWELREPIRERARRGMPIWGTCAGAILLAARCDDPDIEGLRLMDIDVQRNAFGRQFDSFEADLSVPALGEAPFRGVFIRAPRVTRAGERVEPLSTLRDGSVAAARQGAFLATTFHPELTDDLRFHQLFVRFALPQGCGSSGSATKD